MSIICLEQKFEVGDTIQTEHGQATKLVTLDGVEVVVSTVYAGGGEGKEYETMVFHDPGDPYTLDELATVRYATCGESLDGHLAMVEEWKSKNFNSKEA
jgi:hypothetical protein